LWKGGKQENSILKNEKKNLLASEELMYISGTVGKAWKNLQKK
jgi:hypothetical protein